MAPILLNGAGAPEPSPSVTRRLRAIHPDLFLRFIPHVGTSWAVCMGWASNDPRREQVQRGEVGPDRAHDIVGYLPMDASADDAPGYLERMFRSYPSDAVKRLADFVVQEQQASILGAATEEAIGEVLDQADPSGRGAKRRRRS
jgi:hypothetical protein